jgi:hypothetical protein
MPEGEGSPQGPRRRRFATARESLRRRWRALQWPLIGGLGLLALVLGFVGFEHYLDRLGRPNGFWDVLYLDLQLLVLQSGAVREGAPLPWELEVARLLAPAVAGYAVLGAFAVIFRDQLQALRLRFVRDHVVLCGLGAGSLLARVLRERGVRVVAIERDGSNERIEPCREAGAYVFVGDARGRELLRTTGVRRARYLVSVCGNDGVNAEVAARARELVSDRGGQALRCLVHVADPNLCRLLRMQELSRPEVGPLRLDFVNVFESGARALLAEHPPFRATGDGDGARPHMVVVGLGRFGESLLTQAALDWRAGRDRAGERLRVTVIDEDAAQKTESLSSRYPQLGRLCDLAALPLAVDSTEFQRADFLFDRNGDLDVSGVYVCLPDDAQGLAAALVLQQRLKGHGVPVVVRIYDAGLAFLLPGKNAAGAEPEGPIAFALLDRTVEPDLLFADTYEILARTIHDEYRRTEREKGETPETNPSMAPWDELGEDLRDSNRDQAVHTGVKLERAGCDLMPLLDWDAELFEFAPEEVDQLAELEHERWVADNRRRGWTYAPEPKDAERKTSPHMVPWDDLSEEIREYDRIFVRALPAFLARIGYQIVRRV